jgi:hypothetical protein
MYRVFLHVAVILFTLSCEKYSSPAEKKAPRGDKPPIANAGNDVTILYPQKQTSLNANQSYDPDGPWLGYQWRQIGGPSIEMPKYTKFEQWDPNIIELGKYDFELQVEDQWYAKDYDTVSVIFDAPERIITGKIKDIATQAPATDLAFKVCLEPGVKGCKGNFKTVSTNSKGELIFKAKSYSILIEGMDAQGYWAGPPVDSYQWRTYGDEDLTYDVHFSENFQFIMFPKAWVNVTVKDITALPNRTNTFEYLVNTPGGNVSIQKLILRRGIDTTMLVPVYGNLYNEFVVYSTAFDYPQNPMDPSVPYQKEWLVPKGFRDSILISY